MPHIRCRGMKRDDVVAISETLVEQLADLISAPAAHFTIEYIPSEFIATSTVVRRTHSLSFSGLTGDRKYRMQQHN